MSRVRTPILAWSGVAAVLVVVQYASNVLHSGTSDWVRWPGAHAFFAGWWQFDAGEFTTIATDGYWYREGARSPTSFFPLFPLAIRAVRPVFSDPLVGGVVVSALAGLAAAIAFWVWAGRWGGAAGTRVLALWVLLLYPWSWFLYGVPFSDGLFVALVIGAFLLVEDRRYGWAAVVGALATATRPTGLFLAPALVLLALERADVLVPRLYSGQAEDGDADGDGRFGRWWAGLHLPTHLDRARFRWALLVPGLAVCGIAAYSTYLGIRFGHPFAYITDQSLYNGTGIKTWLKAGLVDGWVHRDDLWRTFAQTLEALIALGVLLAVPSVGRRFGWGYGLFTLALVAMPAIATRDFNSTGRYLLAAFPVALVVAERLAARPPAWRWAWLAVSGCLLLALNAAFARSQMVS